MRQTFIYFIQPEGGGPIKVGVSQEPERRLRDLQIGSPVRLRLCRAVEAAPDFEARLHVTFAAWRLHGEWFEAVPALARLGDAVPDESLPDVALDLVGVPETAHQTLAAKWAALAKWREQYEGLEMEPDDSMMQTTAEPITYVPGIDPLRHGW